MSVEVVSAKDQGCVMVEGMVGSQRVYSWYWSGLSKYVVDFLVCRLHRERENEGGKYVTLAHTFLGYNGAFVLAVLMVEVEV